jgi:general secretion pathway protein A
MYTHFYGFSQKPFALAPDPKFLFLAEGHRRALEAVLYGISERKGFVCLSAEAGTGKTAILQHLRNTLDKNTKAVFISQAQITPIQLLREIAKKLGLSFWDQGKTALIRQLNESLLSALPVQGNLALLIDEAHHLSPEVLEELRMLSNLETSTSRLIQIVLSGRPELNEKLNSRELTQLKQRIAIRTQIRPLTAEESAGYIDHRLRLVGKSAGEVFSPEAMALIGRHAGGIPRTIHLLGDNALMMGYRRKEKRIPAATVKEVLSDRGMAAEEGGRKTHSFETASRSAKTGSRRTSSAAVYWGVPAALVLILAFLAGGGHFDLLSEKMGVTLGKNEAAAVLKEPFPPIAVRENTPEGYPLPASAEEQKTGGREGPKPEEGVSPAISPAPFQGKDINTHTAEEGETLYAVLRKYYGRANASLLDYLLSANPDFSDPNSLVPGRRIRVPALAEESLIRRSPDGEFQVHLGTFPGREAAEEAGTERKLKGAKIRIESHGVSPRETWHRVLAGGYKSREEALEAAKAFRKMGLLAIFPPS